MAGTFLDHLTSDDVAGLFPQAARSRIKAFWPLIAAQLKEHHLTSREAVLYTIGTISAETRPTFSPGPERSSRHSQRVDKAGYSGIQDAGTVRPFGAYDSTITFKNGKPVINKSLGNAYYRGKDDALMRARHGDTEIPDLNEGEKYRGRGFVQITGKYNYGVMQRMVGGELGIDLLGQPEKAEDPETAARILACFLARHRSTIEKDMKAGHYRAARKVVNHQGLHWEKIERVVHGYDAAEAKKLAKAQAARTMGPPRPSSTVGPTRLP
jgi:peptidoglycan L-alanyl-D-glutamate endopeptidase CwlK